MSSGSEIAAGVFARTVAWWRGLVETAPPALGRCEFECRAPTCAAETFDACDNRLEYASKVREGEPTAVLPVPGRAPAASGLGPADTLDLRPRRSGARLAQRSARPSSRHARIG
jgi:hypothetical protein